MCSITDSIVHDFFRLPVAPQAPSEARTDDSAISPIAPADGRQDHPKARAGDRVTVAGTAYTVMTVWPNDADGGRPWAELTDGRHYYYRPVAEISAAPAKTGDATTPTVLAPSAPEGAALAPSLIELGAAHASYFHDHPDRFFAQMNRLSSVEIGELLVALSAFWEQPIEVVSAFLTKSRARFERVSAEDVTRDLIARRYSAMLLKTQTAAAP